MPAGRYWTTAELRAARVARANGALLADIAEDLGRSVPSVRNVVQRHRMQRPCWGHGKLRGGIMAALRQHGPMTAADLRHQLRCNPTSLYSTLTKLAVAGHVRKLGNCRWGLRHG